MKAQLTNFPNYILILTPESTDDQTTLQEAVTVIGAGCLITSRWFKYMSKEVSFYIQPMPRLD